MRVVEFFVPGKPIALGRARMSGGKMYAPERSRRAKEVIALYARSANRGMEPAKGPVKLELHFQFHSKKVRGGRNRHTSRPDVSNLAKLVEDALEGIFYAEDKQVSELTAIKRRVRYEKNQGTLIIVTAGGLTCAG